jgi:hypothetical protein
MRALVLVGVISLTVALGACSDDRRGGGDPNHGVDFSQGPGFDGGVGTCSDSAKLVYLVDDSGVLLSFKPDTLTFTKIGTLDCPAQFGATPFSMGVDRTPTAWVLYNSGEIFKVSTEDGSCQPTTFSPGQKGYVVFGMGFASDSAGSSDETLYIAGGSDATTMTPTSQFGSIAFPSLTVSSKGSVTGWPELTGTGEGNLWGFFPSETTTPRVAQLDKGSGVDLTTYPLSTLLGHPAAWAFAHWGGDFWVFLERDTDSSTNVYRVNGSTGAVSTAKSSIGRVIVGAGVSTCAPTMIL